MDSIHVFTNVLDDINEPGYLDYHSHSQNSAETSESSTLTELLSQNEPLTSTLIETSTLAEISIVTESILNESSPISETVEEELNIECSVLSNGTYDGSGETSDESYVVPASSSTVFHEFQVSGPSQESYETAASNEESESVSETSQNTQDEFPEISQLQNLFELFETCPLTEAQKDNLHDKLIESLIKDRRKLSEMEASYGRRVKFIKEFEAARKASDESKFNASRDQSMASYTRLNSPLGDAGPVLGAVNPTIETADPEIEAVGPEIEAIRPELETIGQAHETANSASRRNPPNSGPVYKPKTPATKNETSRIEGVAATLENENFMAEEVAVVSYNENPEIEETADSFQIENSMAAALVKENLNEEAVSIQRTALPFLNGNNGAAFPTNFEEHQTFPLEVTTLNRNTKILIPGLQVGNYDIEVTIQTNVRGVQRPGVDNDEANNKPVILHCIIPSLRFFVEEISNESTSSEPLPKMESFDENQDESK